MWWEKIGDIDPRILYIILTVVLAIPIIRPIGLPISINKDLTLPFYEFLDNLPSDSIVFFDIAYGPATDTEHTPMVTAAFEHLARKDVKVVVGGQWNQGVNYVYPILQSKSEELGLIYGEDWVNIGFKTGGTATWRVMAEDFWKGAMSHDISNVNFDDLPLMSRVEALDKDTIAAVICFDGGSPGFDTWYKYFPEIPLLKGCVSGEIASSVRFVHTGQLKGMLGSMRGAAEYEKLVGSSGVATQLMDAQTLTHLLVVLFIVMGNVSYVMSRKHARNS